MTTKVTEFIAHISSCMTLNLGDILLTGTPVSETGSDNPGDSMIG
jgi:2-keto-4-pentenoate hydratase/2-oxohepta-3-ene-1,7-dioic acid hydratase in catechol pathway